VGGLYDYAWQQRRVAHLRRDPLCAFCMTLGRATPASVADHIVPHRGNADLFNGAIQSLCKACHDSVKKQIEQGGSFKGCDTKGMPLDTNHHWHKERARK
jgi:5-methylcytosine-specific restriction endonuclease McrA